MLLNIFNGVIALEKLGSLQVMRGIAALFVVMFHYNGFLITGSDFAGLYNSLFSKGIIGVDIFFVISGFIMIYTTHHKKYGLVTAKTFLINRLFRILPVYYFGLITAFAVGGAMSLFHYPEKMVNLVSAITFTVYRSDIAPHYIDDGGLYNIRWTLNYELYFYTAFAVCLCFRFRVIALLTWGLLAVVIVPMLGGFAPTLGMHGYPWHNPWYGFLTNPIILEFLIGAFFAYLYIALKEWAKVQKVKLLFMLSSLIMIIYFAVRLYSGVLCAMYIPTTLAIGFLIFSLSMADALLCKYIPKSLEILGDISFSLYLLHSLVGIFIFKKLGKLYESDIYRILVVILALILSIVAAYYSHKYIEVKLVNFLKRKTGVNCPACLNAERAERLEP
ncbi:acyltransferase [Atlantibacter hermannii]|uniref:acyltransferase family protein n=1 Tax=Atlantibacter hermannii TaxID=565 RepID=UPI002FD8E496